MNTILKKSGDWDHVHKFAVALANASGSRGNDRLYQSLHRKMLRLLNRLQRKYPCNPDIIATKADYVKSDGYQLRLLKTALKYARKKEDKMNIKMILEDLDNLTPSAK